MIVKAFTHGSKWAYPDCSQILDVFGCILQCMQP
jgi:hypothetical protein